MQAILSILGLLLTFGMAMATAEPTSATATYKRFMVTGGAGFVGSHLCQKLLKMGHSVIAVDNLFTGNRDNFSKFKDNPRFTFINHDIVNPLDIPVDGIFNLACPASPPAYQSDPIFTTKTNVVGIINMLELAKKYNAPLLQASTSEVYGDPAVHPQTEEYRGSVNPIGIRSCYDEGKRCAESLCFDYQRMHGVRIKVVRIFNTYGPHMNPNDGRVISNFIMQALRGEPITIYGDGQQTRSFCYVDDLVQGILAMMFNTTDDVTGPINLGNPSEYTINEIAHEIIRLVGSMSTIIHKRLPQDDPTRRKPDISRAIEKLGWQPKTPVEVGLKKTIGYFKALDFYIPH